MINNVQRTANLQNIILHDTYYKWIFITSLCGIWSLSNSLFNSYQDRAEW